MLVASQSRHCGVRPTCSSRARSSTMTFREEASTPARQGSEMSRGPSASHCGSHNHRHRIRADHHPHGTEASTISTLGTVRTTAAQSWLAGLICWLTPRNAHCGNPVRSSLITCARVLRHSIVISYMRSRSPRKTWRSCPTQDRSILTKKRG